MSSKQPSKILINKTLRNTRITELQPPGQPAPVLDRTSCDSEFLPIPRDNEQIRVVSYPHGSGRLRLAQRRCPRTIPSAQPPPSETGHSADSAKTPSFTARHHIHSAYLPGRTIHQWRFDTKRLRLQRIHLLCLSSTWRRATPRSRRPIPDWHGGRFVSHPSRRSIIFRNSRSRSLSRRARSWRGRIRTCPIRTRARSGRASEFKLLET